MNIRRNMSSNVMYQDIKDYFCFKSLAKDNDVLLLKQILPLVVKRVPLELIKENINHLKNIYIPQQNNESLITGYPISTTQSLTQIKQNSKIKLLVIQRSIYNILQHVFFKSIPFLDQLKSFQKLNFLYRSKLSKHLFSGYIYRKDDQIRSIYYLIKGQIKLSKFCNEKQQIVCTLQQNNFFGIYQFSENNSTRILNAKSASNDTLVLQISLDMTPEAFGNDEYQVIQNILKLNSQLTKINESKQSVSVRDVKKSKQFIKAFQFYKRMNQFQKQRQVQILNLNIRQQKNYKNQFGKSLAEIKCSPFCKYVQNKSLLLKVNDANKISQSKKNKCIQKIQAKFLKNNSIVRYYSRLNDHRLSNSGCMMNKDLQKNKYALTFVQKNKYKKSSAQKLMQQYLTKKQNFTQQFDY